MVKQVRTHLMFDGAAEQAMNFYVGLFPNSEIIESQRYAEGASKGKLRQGVFTLAGREFICIDTPISHNFTFTPAMSLFIDCDCLSELRRLFAALADGGRVLMPLDDHGFSTQFGWVDDRFGVSWQLNLP